MHAQVRCRLARRARAERAVQSHLEERVGQQGNESRGDTNGPPDATGDERVERAAVGNVPRHRHVANGEERQDHRYGDECRGNAGQAGCLIRGRDDPGRHSERCDTGQDEEQYSRYAESVFSQRPGHDAWPRPVWLRS